MGDYAFRAIKAYLKQQINYYITQETIMAIISNERQIMGTEYNESKLPARLLAVAEVANFLGIHSSTVRRWEKKGLLKSYAIGLRHNLRFKQEDILSFLNSSRKQISDID
jgi:excisionase family DNA binding protein